MRLNKSTLGESGLPFALFSDKGSYWGMRPMSIYEQSNRGVSPPKAKPCSRYSLCLFLLMLAALARGADTPEDTAKKAVHLIIDGDRAQALQLVSSLPDEAYFKVIALVPKKLGEEDQSWFSNETFTQTTTRSRNRITSLVASKSWEALTQFQQTIKSTRFIQLVSQQPPNPDLANYILSRIEQETDPATVTFWFYTQLNAVRDSQSGNPSVLRDAYHRMQALVAAAKNDRTSSSLRFDAETMLRGILTSPAQALKAEMIRGAKTPQEIADLVDAIRLMPAGVTAGDFQLTIEHALNPSVFSDEALKSNGYEVNRLVDIYPMEKLPPEQARDVLRTYFMAKLKLLDKTDANEARLHGGEFGFSLSPTRLSPAQLTDALNFAIAQTGFSNWKELETQLKFLRDGLQRNVRLEPDELKNSGFYSLFDRVAGSAGDCSIVGQLSR